MQHISYKRVQKLNHELKYERNPSIWSVAQQLRQDFVTVRLGNRFDRKSRNSHERAKFYISFWWVYLLDPLTFITGPQWRGVPPTQSPYKPVSPRPIKRDVVPMLYHCHAISTAIRATARCDCHRGSDVSLRQNFTSPDLCSDRPVSKFSWTVPLVVNVA